MKLKLEGFRKSAVPTRMAKRLDDVVHVKPVANHRYNVSDLKSGLCRLLHCFWTVDWRHRHRHRRQRAGDMGTRLLPFRNLA